MSTWRERHDACELAEKLRQAAAFNRYGSAELMLDAAEAIEELSDTEEGDTSVFLQKQAS